MSLRQFQERESISWGASLALCGAPGTAGVPSTAQNTGELLAREACVLLICCHQGSFPMGTVCGNKLTQVHTTILSPQPWLHRCFSSGANWGPHWECCLTFSLMGWG